MLHSRREEDDDALELDGLDEPVESRANPLDAPPPDGGDDVFDDCPPLDDEQEQVGYELFAWDASDLDLLDDALHELGLPHEWVNEGFELVVHEVDEATIDELLPKIRYPDELPAMDDDADGGPSFEVLGQLFVAADRIHRDPRSDGVSDLLDIAEDVGDVPPFGLAPSAWENVSVAVDDVIDALHADRSVAEITELAHVLRERVRPYV